MNDCECKNKTQCWEPCGELGKSEQHAVKSKEFAVDAVLTYQAHTFGEADGPFKCEHLNNANHANCGNKTWSIFTETKMESTRALCAGIALCSEHQPERFDLGGHSLASMVKVYGRPLL